MTTAKEPSPYSWLSSLLWAKGKQRVLPWWQVTSDYFSRSQGTNEVWGTDKNPQTPQPSTFPDNPCECVLTWKFIIQIEKKCKIFMNNVHIDVYKITEKKPSFVKLPHSAFSIARYLLVLGGLCLPSHSSLLCVHFLSTGSLWTLVTLTPWWLHLNLTVPAKTLFPR